MKRASDILRILVFLAAALILNFPVIATLVTSLKSNAEIARNPGLWVEAPTLGNYAAIFDAAGRFDVWTFLNSSLVAAAIGTILPIIVCFPAAWVMARRGVGAAILFPATVNLRTLPLIVFAIPLYIMYQSLGLLDTRLGLGLILAVVNLPIALLILVNTIRDLPVDLEEAARMDGASLPTLLLRIVLPLCRPGLVTVFILGFITAWNEFLFGLMLTTRDAVPITVGASFFFASGGGGVEWGVAAAIIVIAAAPPVVLGLFMYRHIGGSMTTGAVKG
ncbi:multiple sugar transport system permease protein [Palleronia aestuarii]|uniref:Multiple sugar transport system permease protein n=1 Tax=Palleronia aestuarii TaxID=568105 RepID=A0A2W7NF05_9RHOB|nr:carbohydrate ABC transporter permease [Palleronia aestuarii]PZX11716.1 multiple sugar transport system permease protein [Palleronia aestuarii]